MNLIRMIVGAAGMAAMGAAGQADAMLVVLSGTPGTTGATGAYVDSLGSLTTSDATATVAELSAYIGAPDDYHVGIGSHWIQYDLGDYKLVDGTGFDFNVYEVDGGSVEFGSVDVLVSADGVTFHNVDLDFGAAVNLAGDELHGNASFRRGYDLANAAAALGVTEFRYIRLDGTSSGTVSGDNGFDPDAVGLVNFVAPPAAVPEPATWAMLIAGFGLAGTALRRRARTSLRFA